MRETDAEADIGSRASGSITRLQLVFNTGMDLSIWACRWLTNNVVSKGSGNSQGKSKREMKREGSHARSADET
jgi:hypothetical protein